MKIRAIFAGLTIGIATLAFASNHHSTRSVSVAAFPTPLCPPDNPNCGLNKPN